MSHCIKQNNKLRTRLHALLEAHLADKASDAVPPDEMEALAAIEELLLFELLRVLPR